MVLDAVQDAVGANLSASVRDVALVQVEVLDAAGVRVPTASHTVTLDVSVPSLTAARLSLPVSRSLLFVYHYLSHACYFCVCCTTGCLTLLVVGEWPWHAVGDR